MTATEMTTGRRRRRAIARNAGAAVAGLLLAPAAADAQAPALMACDPADRAQRPALVVQGLPAEIAPGRDIPFRVVRAAPGSTRAAYRGGASVATERPNKTNLLTEYFLDGRDDRTLSRGMPYWIRMRPGEGPATVTLAYTQDTPAGRCRVRIARTVRAVAPRAVRVRLATRRTAEGTEARLSVGGRGGCWRARAGSTTVRVSRGRRRRSVRLADLCERWSARSLRLGGVRVRAAGGGASRALVLRAAGARARYRVLVSFRGRVVLRRNVVLG